MSDSYKAGTWLTARKLADIFIEGVRNVQASKSAANAGNVAPEGRHWKVGDRVCFRDGGREAVLSCLHPRDRAVGLEGESGLFSEDCFVAAPISLPPVEVEVRNSELCPLCHEPMAAHGFRHMLTAGKDPKPEICPPGALEREAEKALRWPEIPSHMVDPLVFRDVNLGIVLVASQGNGDKWIYRVHGDHWCSVRKVDERDGFRMVHALNLPRVTVPPGEVEPIKAGTSDIALAHSSFVQRHGAVSTRAPGMREALDEGQRQLLILALAELALSRPGFEDALARMANLFFGSELFQEFKRMNADRVKASHGPFGFAPTGGSKE